uniref:Uncharacterized protein n=1 Tax=Anguilla anguilla TaxID=7936 RepID=A0A0E9TKS6_ANGAN
MGMYIMQIKATFDSQETLHHPALIDLI